MKHGQPKLLLVNITAKTIKTVNALRLNGASVSSASIKGVVMFPYRL